MERRNLNRIIEILVEEVGLLGDLHSVLEAEQRALVDGRVEEIHRCVEKQISILDAVSRLEEGRLTVLDEAGLPADGDDRRLGNLIETAPEPEAGRLREIRAALRDVTQALGSVNKHNNLLISQSLSYIDSSLKLIAGEDASSKVYRADGSVTCPTGRIAVDRKV